MAKREKHPCVYYVAMKITRGQERVECSKLRSRKYGPHFVCVRHANMIEKMKIREEINRTGVRPRGLKRKLKEGKIGGKRLG